MMVVEPQEPVQTISGVVVVGPQGPVQADSGNTSSCSP